MELSELILHAKQADKTMFTSFQKEYFERVKAVASEVLREPEEAELSADLTLRNAYKLLGNGVNPTVLEPWLLWLAREDALEILNRRRTLIRQEIMLTSGNLLDLYDSDNRNLVFASPEDWRLLGEPDEDIDSENIQKEEASEEDLLVKELLEEEIPDDDISERELFEEEMTEKELPEEAMIDDEPAQEEMTMDDVSEEDDLISDVPQKSPAGITVLKVVEALLILLLLWFIFGFIRSNLLIDTSLPDLGYEWFNTHIYPMFGKEQAFYEYVFLQKYQVL